MFKEIAEITGVEYGALVARIYRYGLLKQPKKVKEEPAEMKLTELKEYFNIKLGDKINKSMVIGVTDYFITLLTAAGYKTTVAYAEMWVKLNKA